MKMFGKLLGSEEINATLAMALSGTLMMLVAKGDGPISLKRLVLETLSNRFPAVMLRLRLIPTCSSSRPV